MRLLIIQLLLTYVIACNAISCYKCNSIAEADCALTLNTTELSFVDCPPTALQCMSSIVDSITYRGCSGDTPIIGATFYSYCTENLCNGGVYPPGRRKCYQCSGSDCRKKPKGKPHPCLWHQINDECFTDVINETQTYRGCRSDTNHTISAYAMFCKYNGCNDQDQDQHTLTCALCDSRYDRGCKMDAYNFMSPICNITEHRNCHVEVSTLSPKSCFTYHKLDRVVRGCTSYIPDDLDKVDLDIVECNDQDHCNNLCLKQQKCYICDSRENSACLNNLSAIPNTTCTSTEMSSCHVVQYDDNEVKRGCGKPAGDSDIKRRYECDGQGCNSISLTRCYQCSSDIKGACAAWGVPDFGLNVEDCSELDAACVTAELKNGIVVRGCESNVLSCNNNNKTIVDCRRCEGSFCNKGQFHNLIHCYQCSGADDCTAPMPCVPDAGQGNKRQACFIYNNPFVGIVRGCQTHTAELYECLINNRNGCKLCNEDGCNKNSRAEQ